MSAKARKYSLLIAVLGIAAPLLAACSGNTIEAPFYDTTNVEGFKRYAAPSNVMVMEVHDGQTGIDDESWAKLFSGRGFAPQLQFITPETARAEMANTDSKDTHPTLRPKHRMVVVVNPTQDTSRNTMCENPQNAPATTAPGETTTPVRFAFCSSDSIVSELRANINTPIDQQQLDQMAPAIIHYLFPINQPDRNDNRCSRFAPC